jgi:aldehyde:ferredoxin oxidoreductase
MLAIEYCKFGYEERYQKGVLMTGGYGYAGKILRVDLSSGKIVTVSTMDYVDRFLGGRGIAEKIYWDEVAPDAKALAPDNRLIFMTGPLAGISPGVGAVRWIVCGKSPVTTPEQFSYCNLGGSWGTELKFAGYDGVVVFGKSDKPVYLNIEDEVVEVKDASTLWGKSTLETREMLKQQLGGQTRVVTIGPAGEHMSTIATILADNDASGSSGFGAVMGSKNLKAITVKGSGKIATAGREKLTELIHKIREMRRTSPSESTWGRGGLPDKKRIDICRGCSLGCERNVYESKDGRQGKFICGQVVFYSARPARYYGEKDWQEVPFQAAMLANDYGLDVFAVGPMMQWLSRCNQAGILTDENTGIPLSKMGSMDFIETLIRKISQREGFGDVLADGIMMASKRVGKGSDKSITDYLTKGEQGLIFDPRYFITTGLLYAMEPRLPIQQLHETSRLVHGWLSWVNKLDRAFLSTDVCRAIAKRFWGTELAFDLSTYEGKALTAINIQNREYAKESLILCDWVWPIMSVEFSENHIGDPSLESKIVSLALGEEIDEKGLNKIGERLVNLQRAIITREARGSDTIADFHFTVPQREDPMNPKGFAPGKDGEVIIKKGAVLDRTKFEEMKREYYQLRGWDAKSGLQTKVKLEELELKDIANELEKRKLIV